MVGVGVGFGWLHNKKAYQHVGLVYTVKCGRVIPSFNDDLLLILLMWYAYISLKVCVIWISIHLGAVILTQHY